MVLEPGWKQQQMRAHLWDSVCSTGVLFCSISLGRINCCAILISVMEDLLPSETIFSLEKTDLALS